MIARRTGEPEPDDEDQGDGQADDVDEAERRRELYAWTAVQRAAGPGNSDP